MHIERDIPRERLSAAANRGAPHLAPIFRAVRDRRCAMAVVSQDAGPFLLPSDPGRPLIALIGDDTTRSLGPAGFDAASLARLIQRCPAAVVISSGAMAEVYSAAAEHAASGRRDVLVVETRIEHELPWIDIIRRHRPDVSLVVSTLKGGTA